MIPNTKHKIFVRTQGKFAAPPIPLGHKPSNVKDWLIWVFEDEF